MNKTKKGFMYAGGIIGIVCAVFLIFTALAMLAARSIITVEFVTDTINQATNMTAAEKTEALAHIDSIVSISKQVCTVMGIFLTGLAVANLVLSIKVNKQASEGSNKRGVTIALLVISIISANLLTAAFMIVSLCLKFKEQPINTTPSNNQDVVTAEVE